MNVPGLVWDFLLLPSPTLLRLLRKTRFRPAFRIDGPELSLAIPRTYFARGRFGLVHMLSIPQALDNSVQWRVFYDKVSS